MSIRLNPSRAALRALKILAIAHRSSIKGQAELALEDAATALYTDIQRNSNSKYTSALKQLNEEEYAEEQRKAKTPAPAPAPRRAPEPVEEEDDPTPIPPPAFWGSVIAGLRDAECRELWEAACEKRKEKHPLDTWKWFQEQAEAAITAKGGG